MYVCIYHCLSPVHTLNTPGATGKKRRKTAKGGLNQSWSSVDTMHNDRIFFEKRREKMMIIYAVKLHRPPT
jgi:hypothetical protein